MKQQTRSSQEHHDSAEAASPNKRRGRRWLAAGIAVAVLGAFSAAGLSHANDGPGWQRHHGMGMSQMDPETAAKHIEKRINRMLPDGTPEQKAKLAAIAKAAMTDLQPLRAQHRAARQQGLALLSAATVDRAALEQLRAGQMQLADQVSKRIVQAMADAAEVLTPEQRVKLAERMKQRMGHRC